MFRTSAVDEKGPHSRRSRNRIRSIDMYRQLPTTSRRIGFEIEPPREVEVQAGDVVRCRERAGGETIGELEVSVFHAALVIDRDGILEEKAQSAVERAAEPGARVLPAIPV